MDPDQVTRPGRMEVFSSFNQAIEHTKRVLFRPFDFNRWFSFGLIVFISVLARGGGGVNLSYAGQTGMWKAKPFDFAYYLRRMEGWVGEHWDVALLVGVTAGFVIVGTGLLLIWLNSRGQMMLIRAVALQREGISENWRETRRPAWSLFLFQTFLYVLNMTIALVVFAGAYSALRDLVYAGPTDIVTILWELAPFGAMLAVAALPLWLVGVLLTCFVTPLMYHFDIGCLEAWGAFRRVARGNAMPLLGFLALRFVYQMGYATVAAWAGCLTCCIGALPVVRQALFAPYHVFNRAFSMYIIQSAGPEYEIIPEQEVDHDPMAPVAGDWGPPPEDEPPEDSGTSE